MLIPMSGLPIREYDATFVITPTSKFDHDSDTVLATVEMLVENNQPEDIDFPFAVLVTDSGDGAENSASVEPHVTNGSRGVAVQPEEIDEEQFAQTVVANVRAAGETDETKIESYRQWAVSAIRRAERTRVGRTKIRPGERRRIILQQRLRVLPGPDGLYRFETIAPSPVGVLQTGGRVSVVVILPFEDDDIRVEITEATGDYEHERGSIKTREWAAWHWKNDPIFRLVYRYV